MELCLSGKERTRPDRGLLGFGLECAAAITVPSASWYAYLVALILDALPMLQVNWQLAALTGDDSYEHVAKALLVGLEPNQFNNRTHDVGFMMYYSYGLGYRAVPALRAKYGPVIFNTAKSLADRFNAKVGCTESWAPGKHCNARSAHKDDICKFTVIIGKGSLG